MVEAVRAAVADYYGGALAIPLEEVARRIGVSRAWLYGPTGPLRSGELRTFYLGKRRLCRLLDLELWLADRVAESNGTAAAEAESPAVAGDEP